ncbi:MAG TPA: hypothetical protein VN029_03110, partial [Sphingomonas sp.]|nr:hypothetical protein [Sphingomonas sp.]
GGLVAEYLVPDAAEDAHLVLPSILKLSSQNVGYPQRVLRNALELRRVGVRSVRDDDRRLGCTLFAG